VIEEYAKCRQRKRMASIMPIGFGAHLSTAAANGGGRRVAPTVFVNSAAAQRLANCSSSDDSIGLRVLFRGPMQTPPSLPLSQTIDARVRGTTRVIPAYSKRGRPSKTASRDVSITGALLYARQAGRRRARPPGAFLYEDAGTKRAGEAEVTRVEALVDREAVGPQVAVVHGPLPSIEQELVATEAAKPVWVDAVTHRCV
jgi:hypothetical protein